MSATPLESHLDDSPPERKSSGPFLLGDWRVEPASHRLEGPDGSKNLEPRAMELLEFLAERSGEVISKQELLEAVWEGLSVTENVLAQAVKALRRALGDDWRNPKYIETISKRGYRLLEEPRPIQPVLLPGLEPAEAPTHRLGILGAITTLSLVMFWVWMSRSPSVPPPTILRPVPVTSLQGAEIHPALSPDGQRVAFSLYSEEPRKIDLWVQVVGDGNPQQLTDSSGSDLSPRWSQDGRFLIFIRRESDSCTIQKISASGGPTTRLASCQGSLALDLSPDGAWIALNHREEGSPNQIRLIHRATGEVRDLTTPEGSLMGDLEPRFSPDGQWILFRRVRMDHQQDLWVMPTAGGDPWRVTFGDRWLQGHDWNTDGNGFVWAWKDSTGWTLWQASLSEAKPRRLPVADDSPNSPDIVDDFLIYASTDMDINVWSAPLELEPPSQTSSPPRPVLTSTRCDLHPQVAPDGRRLAFISDRSGSFEIWSSSVDGSQPVQLTSLSDAQIGQPRWTSDGKTIVFEALEDGQADLWKIHSAGGRPQRLTSAASDEVHPTVSRDGQRVYFSSNREDGWQIWEMPLEGGKARRVTRHGGYSAQEAEEGHLLITHYDRKGLWRLGSDGNSEELVTAALNPIDWGSWISIPGGVLFPDRVAGTVTFFDFSTEASRPILEPPFPIPGDEAALAISPDLETLYFGQIEGVQSDLKLLHLTL